MKQVILCLGDSLEIPKEFDSKKLTYKQIESLLKSDAYSGQKVTIASNLTNASYALSLAKKFKKTVLIDDKTYSFVPNDNNRLTEDQSHLLFIDIANSSASLHTAFFHYANFLLKSVPKKMSIKDALDSVMKSVPAIQNIDSKKIAEKAWDKALKLFNQAIKEMFSFNIDNVNRFHTEIDPDGLEELSNNTDCQLIILTGDTGTGKSTALNKLFRKCEESDKLLESNIKSAFMQARYNHENHLSNDTYNELDTESTPIYAVCITARVSFAERISHQDNYYKYNSPESARSFVTCINTALLNDLVYKSICNSKRIFFEELHEVMCALTEDHMGRNLRDKQKAILNFFNLFRIVANSKDKKIIVTDANFPEEFAQLLIKKTGIKILSVHLTNARKRKPRTIHVLPKKENIAMVYEALENGKNVLASNTGSIKGTERGITKDAYAMTGTSSKNKKPLSKLKIDAKVISADYIKTHEGKYFINHLDEFFRKNKFAIFTPCFTSGHSIITPIALVSIITSRINSPLTVYQISNRARANEEIALTIVKNTVKLDTFIETIYSDEVKKGHSDDELKEIFVSLRKEEGIQEILELISYRNKILNDYENNVLKAFEFFGDKLVYDTKVCVEHVEKLINNASRLERLERTAFYYEEVSIDRANEIFAKDEEDRTVDEKMLAYGISVSDFYNAEKPKHKLTKEELNQHKFTQALKFDNKGKGRDILNTLHNLRSNFVLSDATKKAKHELVAKFFELTDLNENTLGGTFTSLQFKSFCEFVKNEKLLDVITAKSVLKQHYYKVYEEMFLSKKTSHKKIMTAFLSATLGLEFEKAHGNNGTKTLDVDGVRTSTTVYKITELSKSIIEYFYDQAFPENEQDFIKKDKTDIEEANDQEFYKEEKSRPYLVHDGKLKMKIGEEMIEV